MKCIEEKRDLMYDLCIELQVQMSLKGIQVYTVLCVKKDLSVRVVRT
jgi:hypothetical protein